MYNLRYHIASLVSVFLALAVGLVLGTVVVERGVLDAQKRTLVESLRGEFAQLSDANAGLRDEAESARTLSRQTIDYVVAGELEGRTVAVVATTGRTDAAAAVQAAVSAAGGTPVLVTIRKPGAALDDGAVRDAIASALRSATSGSVPSTVGALPERVAVALVAEWEGTGVMPLTRALDAAGGIGARALTEGAAVSGIVVVASEEVTTEPFALAIARAAAEAGLPVLGAEVTGQETGAVDALVAAGLSGVDHADRPEGALSVVWILARGVTGYFGVGEGASARFPEIRR